jgi:hypothetical protein
MTVRLSVLGAGSSLPPGRFLVLISVRDWVDPRATALLEGLDKLKIFSYLIENQTRDLPTCSIMPQPTRQPRASRIPFNHAQKLKQVKIYKYILRPSSNRLRKVIISCNHSVTTNSLLVCCSNDPIFSALLFSGGVALWNRCVKLLFTDLIMAYFLRKWPRLSYCN